MAISLSGEQQQIAARIIQIGRERGLSDAEIQGVIAAGWMESRLRNLDHGDRDSLGIFQQRPSQGWGTPAQVTNIDYAINKFIDAFSRSTGRTIGERVANTQRPAAQYRHLYGQLIDNGTVGQILAQVDVGNVPFIGELIRGVSQGSAATNPTPRTATGSGTGGGPTAVEAPTGGYNVPGTGQLSGLPPDASDEEVRAYITRNYGFAAFYLDHAELGPILRRASVEGWDSARLQGAVYATEWWKNTSQTAREWEALQTTDPATAIERQRDLEREITRMWQQLGGQDDTTGQIAALALHALRFGWADDPATLRQAVVGAVQFNPGEGGGEQAVTVDRLQQIAQTYNYDIPRDELADWTRDILSGVSTLDAFQSHVAERAEMGSPWMSMAIQQGFTPDQIQARYEEFKTLAARLGGVDLAKDAARLQMLTAASLLDGWDAARVQREISRHIEFRPGEQGGEQAVTVDQLQQVANAYAVGDILNNQILEDWTRRILAGEQTIDTFKAFVAERAESRFPYLADYIERGFTPRDYFSSHQQQIAQILEVDPDQIDLFGDPRFQQVVGFWDDDQKTTRGMTLSEAARYARALPDARYTDQARDKGAQSVELLAQMFGKTA